MLHLRGGLLFTWELQRGSPEISAVSGITPARRSTCAGRGNTWLRTQEAGQEPPEKDTVAKRNGCGTMVCVPCHLSPDLLL